MTRTGSTNSDLLDRLAGGERIAQGYWLRADRQDGGRGRLGREWNSPIGNLYCSTVVPLRADDPPAHTLALVAGLACSDCLAQSLPSHARVTLKWPNDAMVNTAKIAGILLERTGDCVVAGVGINVVHAPVIEGRATTSIADEHGAYDGSAGQVCSILAECFAVRLHRWRAEPLAATLDAWTDAAHPIGTPLCVGPASERVSGTFAGLEAGGALLLRLADGAMRTIHAGDVSLIAQR